MSELQTDFSEGSTSPFEEQKTLDEICNYLTSLGKYESIDEIKKMLLSVSTFF